MTRYVLQLDRMPVLLCGLAICVYLLMALSELANPGSSGMTQSLTPYYAILVGVGWGAPLRADEMTAATLASQGLAPVSFAIFAFCLGLASAAVTQRLVAAIGITVIGEVAAAYVVPELAQNLAPTTRVLVSWARQCLDARSAARRMPVSSLPSLPTANSGAVKG